MEEDPNPEVLTLADGSTGQTEGRVQIHLSCGGYRGVVQAKVFPGLHKPIILGIPWLRKENPHIDWAREVVVVKQDNVWISLPLTKPTRRPAADMVNMVSAKQMQCILKREEGQAFGKCCPSCGSINFMQKKASASLCEIQWNSSGSKITAVA